MNKIRMFLLTKDICSRGSAVKFLMSLKTRKIFQKNKKKKKSEVKRRKKSSGIFLQKGRYIVIWGCKEIK